MFLTNTKLSKKYSDDDCFPLLGAFTCITKVYNLCLIFSTYILSFLLIKERYSA